jgi:hypothetical protein
MAIADGVVTGVDLGNAVSGTVALTMTDRAGRAFQYAGFNDDTPGTNDGAGHHSVRFTALGQVGTPVRAGQIIGFLGDTDPMPSDEHRGMGSDPVWPHLRITIGSHATSVSARGRFRPPPASTTSPTTPATTSRSGPSRTVDGPCTPTAPSRRTASRR